MNLQDWATAKIAAQRSSAAADPQLGMDPDDLDLDLCNTVADRIQNVFGDDGYFDLSADGWEHFPPEPSLIVSNHSGGTIIPDVWGLMVAWHRHFKDERICHALAHDLVFTVPPIGRLMSKLGVLRAQKDNAYKVLTEYKRDVFVCPGGDKDVWRPWSERNKVCFSGRKGYIKLALKAGVPIIPMANVGPHETLMVLTDGQRLARALRFQEIFRAEVFPIHLSLPWGVGIGPLPHIPLPTKLSYRFGPPIYAPEGWEAGSEPPQALVDEMDERVRTEIQKLLDQLAAERPAPSERIRHVARTVLRRVAPPPQLRKETLAKRAMRAAFTSQTH